MLAKLLLATLIFGLVSHTKQQRLDPAFMKTMKEIKEGCAKEFGFSPDYVTSLTTSEQPLPNDDKLKCYYSCTNLKLGVMDETGDIKMDKLKEVSAEVFSTSIEDEIVENCDVPKDGDLCATAFKLMQCIHKEVLD